MERGLRPPVLSVLPSETDAEVIYTHWKTVMKNYVTSLPHPAVSLSGEGSQAIGEELKVNLVINHISPLVYQLLASAESYDEILDALDSLYRKPRHNILARHSLLNVKQKAHESVRDFMRSIRILGKDCEFPSLSAESHRDTLFRDALVSGLASSQIRQRLLETPDLTFMEAVNLATSLETAACNSRNFAPNVSLSVQEPRLPKASAVPPYSSTRFPDTPRGAFRLPTHYQSPRVPSREPASLRRCLYCGGNSHSRTSFPASRVTCRLCHKRGHYAKVCLSSRGAAAISEHNPDSESDPYAPSYSVSLCP